MNSKENFGLISRIIPRHQEIKPTSAQEQVYGEIRALLQPVEKEYHHSAVLISAEATKGIGIKRGLFRRNEYKFNAETEQNIMMPVMVQTGNLDGDRIMRKFTIDGNTVIFDKNGKIQIIELGGLPERQYHPSSLPMVGLVRGNILGEYGLQIDDVQFKYHRMVISVASPVNMGVNISEQIKDERRDRNLVVGKDGSLVDPQGYVYFKNSIYNGGGFPKLAKDALRAVDIFRP